MVFVQYFKQTMELVQVIFSCIPRIRVWMWMWRSFSLHRGISDCWTEQINFQKLSDVHNQLRSDEMVGVCQRKSHVQHKRSVSKHVSQIDNAVQTHSMIAWIVDSLAKTHCAKSFIFLRSWYRLVIGWWLNRHPFHCEFLDAYRLWINSTSISS